MPRFHFGAMPIFSSQVAPYCTRTTQAKYLTYGFIHLMRKYRSKIIVARIRVAQLWYTRGIDQMSVDVLLSM
jgi:hypothetical protein